MAITLDFVLVLVAVICFFLAAISVSSPKINLVALGLFFWALSVLI